VARSSVNILPQPCIQPFPEFAPDRRAEETADACRMETVFYAAWHIDLEIAGVLV
jgi:hypothetical protein